MINTLISKYFYVICFCILSIACNTRNKYAKINSLMLHNNDTLVFNGCQEKIKAKVGSILEIQLEAIPVIGYEWIRIDSSALLKEHKTDVLKYISQGETSFQVIYFEAKKKGRVAIRLEYKRVFEKDIKKICNTLIEIY